MSNNSQDSRILFFVSDLKANDSWGSLLSNMLPVGLRECVCVCVCVCACIKWKFPSIPILHFKEFLRDFLGPVVKNPPASAGDVQFPGPGTEIPCAMEQLSPCTTNTDAYVFYSLCFAIREATAIRSLITATSPRLPHLEKAHEQQWRAHVPQWRPITAKNKWKKEVLLGISVGFYQRLFSICGCSHIIFLLRLINIDELY